MVKKTLWLLELELNLHWNKHLFDLFAQQQQHLFDEPKKTLHVCTALLELFQDPIWL